MAYIVNLCRKIAKNTQIFDIRQIRFIISAPDLRNHQKYRNKAPRLSISIVIWIFMSACCRLNFDATDLPNS